MQVIESEQKIVVSYKQNLINNIIWLLIAEGLFFYFGKQMEADTIGGLGIVIWFASSFYLLFGANALARILNERIKNTLLAYLISFGSLTILNTILVLFF